MYIHEKQAWPQLTYDLAQITALLVEVRYSQGRLLGYMSGLGFQVREEATLRILTQDVLKTSEIEGESLNTEQIRSSLAKRLGMDAGATLPIDRNVEGIVEVMLDATRNYAKPLTKERLFDWHAALFPTGRSGMQRITVGGWRTEASGAMQVVSGAYGHEKVHYEAPSYDRLEKEMIHFFEWFNSPSDMDLVIKSALAHFWFVTIHPFDDGNGRIARAIADMLLARSEQSSERFYSMSSQIQQERKAYYAILEQSQKGTLDITSWMKWYLNCLRHAIEASENVLQVVLARAQFWVKHASEQFNDRQRCMINHFLNNHSETLSSSKWAKLTKCSQDTALRDINELLERSILIKEEAGGRSTNYRLLL